MGRTVIVGDVHGCRAELEILIDRVGFTSGDRLVFVGDVVARGPDSIGVLDIVRRTGAVLVRGNHEDKLVGSREHDTHPLVWKDTPASKSRPPKKPLGRFHAGVAEQLRPVDWALLEASPLYVDLPEHDVRVVHAGVLPGVPIEEQERSTLLTIRAVGPHGEPLEKRGGVLWGERYRDSPHVVFGHNARSEPQLHPHATGLDTGCVYGGYLTALMLEDGQKVPMDAGARKKLMVQVPAAKAYYASD
jgi:Calcineurin-like phosphoesterase